MSFSISCLIQRIFLLIPRATSLDINSIHREYLQNGTIGYLIVRKFYSRYADILKRTSLFSFDDVVHEVLLSFSKTDLSSVDNVQNYMLRAIKLRCWSLLDKAIKLKEMHFEPIENDDQSDESNRSLPKPLIHRNDDLEEVLGMELFGFINLFKSNLAPHDKELLNYLIDGIDRSEIAAKRNTNINTVDTHIRRLRIRLADYLSSLGYTYTSMQRFGS